MDQRVGNVLVVGWLESAWMGEVKAERVGQVQEGNIDGHLILLEHVLISIGVDWTTTGI
jgi:hypothetical protein